MISIDDVKREMFKNYSVSSLVCESENDICVTILNSDITFTVLPGAGRKAEALACKAPPTRQ